MYPLLIPYLLFFLVLTTLGTFCFKKWKWGIGMLLAAMVINCIFHIFALHPLPKKEGKVKVMFLNVHGWSNTFDNTSIANLILSEDADIICLAEHYYPYSSKLDTLLKANGYRYGNDYTKARHWDGSVFYAKERLSDVVQIQRSRDSADEMFLTSLTTKNDTINVCMCHLASNNVIVGTSIAAPVDSIHSYLNFHDYLKNITKAGKIRKAQTEFLCDSIDFCKPTLVLGDMNDLWGSGALRTFQKTGLNDAWWHAGFGYGATIHHPLPFRIDHILYSPHLKVRTVKRVKTHGLSDHDAVVATFDFREYIF